MYREAFRDLIGQWLGVMGDGAGKKFICPEAGTCMQRKELRWFSMKG
jgi:hypothetical protein